MNWKADLFVSLAFASLAAAQSAAEGTVDRVLHFTSGRTEKAAEEIATVIRSIANIRQLSIDSKENARYYKGRPVRPLSRSGCFACWISLPADQGRYRTS